LLRPSLDRVALAIARAGHLLLSVESG